jgi:XRE family transcriptional regulator, regulator of sulfur utilization
MDNPSEHIPCNLKRLRENREWSLNRTASSTGVSKAMLGQIERAESSPTIATLWKIAKGFNVSLSSLVEPIPTENEKNVALLRDGDALRKSVEGDGMLVSVLHTYEARVGFEMFELTFHAHYHRLSVAHKDNVIEYVTVISGTLEILVDEEWVLVKTGQSLRFPGDVDHGYRNTADEQAIVHCLIHYPTLRP